LPTGRSEVRGVLSEEVVRVEVVKRSKEIPAKMPSTKIDTPTLFSTISGSSTALPGEALSLFRAYVRANYDDNDSGDGGLKGDAERDLDFVLATGDLDAMDEKGFKDLREDYFSPKFRIVLDNPKLRDQIEEDLRQLGNLKESIKNLQRARSNIWERCKDRHDKWIGHLISKGVLKDRSGETLFSGWLD